MMKNLLITAGVALVCGVIGAMGYAYFFEPKSKGLRRQGPRTRAIRDRRQESGPKEKSGRWGK